MAIQSNRGIQEIAPPPIEAAPTSAISSHAPKASQATHSAQRRGCEFLPHVQASRKRRTNFHLFRSAGVVGAQSALGEGQDNEPFQSGEIREQLAGKPLKLLF